jgi:murein DD-endopeptidase MepM/ murein hydrolase activator NlpD
VVPVPFPRPLTSFTVIGVTAIVLGVPTAFGGGGGGGSLYDQQREVDTKVSELRSDIEQAKGRESVLSTEIEAATSRIRDLELDVAGLSSKLAVLEGDLRAHQARLDELRRTFAYQTNRLRLLRAQYAEAERRLETRLVELYRAEPPDELAIFLRVGTLGEVIEQVNLFNEIARQDKRIAEELSGLKIEMRLTRQRTSRTRARVAAATAVLKEKTAKQRAARDAVLAQEQALESARANKRGLLTSIRADRHKAEEDLGAMLAASAALAARIQRAQSASSSSAAGGTGAVSAAGLAWPLQGVLTSGFGPRWGRMHEGIDIGAPAGSAIAAAAAGTVIFAGSFGGYGNLVVIDHGGGMATAYGHMSAIYVTGGSVSQGQTIGAVGSTGHSTGNHLHFEVRINGSPVDPLGYL